MAVSARHYARLGAVQFLYYWGVQKASLSASDEQCLIDAEVLKHGDLAYFQKLLNSIPSKIPEIDSILSTVIHRKIDTVGPVELAILRLGVYEMLSEPDIPLKVVTNECIELSREFGNPDSYKFINGTLDKLAFGEQAPLKHRSDLPKDAPSIGEFNLIERFFSRDLANSADIVAGVGDDCAVIEVPSGKQLLISTDTLLEDIHFPANTEPDNIGYKSLAVSLSDLAAMGARPAYATLNLSMPEYDEKWLEKFSSGFYELASKYRVALIGGDTVQGPLCISVTVYGLTDSGESLMRSGACVGDGIYVTGTLGDAALGLMNARVGLKVSSRDARYLQDKLERPQPRIDAGEALRKHATSAIDISDGLVADLSHILKASNVGATIDLESIPTSNVYRNLMPKIGWDHALAHGDDYELCFTLSQEVAMMHAELKFETGVPISRIGTVVKQPGLVIKNSSGEIYQSKTPGYSHF